MKLKTYKTALLLIALLPITLIAKKAEYEASKHYEETYSIGKNHKLEIEGSFASFELVNWDKDEIHISGDVKVSARNQAKADEMIENYTVEMSNSGSIVKLKVSLDSNKNKGSSNTDSDVKFTIKAPEWVKLKSRITFGNLDMASKNAETDIYMEYGNLSAIALMGSDNSLSVSFGNINVQDFGGGSLSASFGSAEIAEIKGNTSIESSYSQCQIAGLNGSVKTLDIANSFGQISLSLSAQQAYEVVSNSSFGELSIKGQWNEKHYKSEYDSEQKEGVFGKGNVAGKIKIENSFGNVKISEQ